MGIHCGPDPLVCDAARLSTVLQMFGPHSLHTSLDILHSLTRGGAGDGGCELVRTALLFPLFPSVAPALSPTASTPLECPSGAAVDAPLRSDDANATRQDVDALDALLVQMGLCTMGGRRERDDGPSESGGDEHFGFGVSAHNGQATCTSVSYGDLRHFLSRFAVLAAPINTESTAGLISRAAGFALACFSHEEDGQACHDHIFTAERGTHSGATGVVTVGEALAPPRWLPTAEGQQSRRSVDRDSQRYHSLPSQCRGSGRNVGAANGDGVSRWPLSERLFRPVVAHRKYLDNDTSASLSVAADGDWSSGNASVGGGEGDRSLGAGGRDFNGWSGGCSALSPTEGAFEGWERDAEEEEGATGPAREKRRRLELTVHATHPSAPPVAQLPVPHEGLPSLASSLSVAEIHRRIFFPPPTCAAAAAAAAASAAGVTINASSPPLRDEGRQRRECFRLLPKAIVLSAADAVWAVPIIDAVMRQWESACHVSPSDCVSGSTPASFPANDAADAVLWQSLFAYEVEHVVPPQQRSGGGGGGRRRGDGSDSRAMEVGGRRGNRRSHGERFTDPEAEGMGRSHACDTGSGSDGAHSWSRGGGNPSPAPALSPAWHRETSASGGRSGERSHTGVASAVSVTFAHPLAALLVYEGVFVRLRVVRRSHGGALSDAVRGLRVAFEGFGDVSPNPTTDDARAVGGRQCFGVLSPLPPPSASKLASPISENGLSSTGALPSFPAFTAGGVCQQRLSESPAPRGGNSNRGGHQAHAKGHRRREAAAVASECVYSNFLASLRSRSPTPPRVVLRGAVVGPYKLTKRLGKGNNAVVMMGELMRPPHFGGGGPSDAPATTVEEATAGSPSLTLPLPLPQRVAVKVLLGYSAHAEAEVQTLRCVQNKVRSAPRLVMEADTTARLRRPSGGRSSDRSYSSNSARSSVAADVPLAVCSSGAASALPSGFVPCQLPTQEAHATSDAASPKGFAMLSISAAGDADGHPPVGATLDASAAWGGGGPSSYSLAENAQETSKMATTRPSLSGVTEGPFVTSAPSTAAEGCVGVKAVVMELLGVDLFELACSGLARRGADSRPSSGEGSVDYYSATPRRFSHSAMSPSPAAALADGHSPSHSPSPPAQTRRRPRRRCGPHLAYTERLSLTLAMVTALMEFHEATNMVHGSVKLENYCTPRSLEECAEGSRNFGHKKPTFSSGGPFSSLEEGGRTAVAPTPAAESPLLSRSRYASDASTDADSLRMTAAEREGLRFATALHSDTVHRLRSTMRAARLLEEEGELPKEAITALHNASDGAPHLALHFPSAHSFSHSSAIPPSLPTSRPRLCLIDYGRSRPAAAPRREEPFTGWWYSDWAMMGLPLRQIDDLVSNAHAISYLLAAGGACDCGCVCGRGHGRGLGEDQQCAYGDGGDDDDDEDEGEEEQCRCGAQWSIAREEFGGGGDWGGPDTYDDALKPPERQFVDCRKARLAALSDMRDALVEGHRRRANFAPLCTITAAETGADENDRPRLFVPLDEVPRQLSMLMDAPYATPPFSALSIFGPEAAAGMCTPSVPLCVPRWWARACDAIHTVVARYTAESLRSGEAERPLGVGAMSMLVGCDGVMKAEAEAYYKVELIIRSAIESELLRCVGY